MKIQFRLLVVVLGTICFFNTGYAQKGSDKETVNKVIRDFANAYDKLDETKDVESVLTYISRDLFSTIVRSDVGGKLGLIESRFEDFENFLTMLSKSKDLSNDYKIEKFYDTYVQGSTAFAAVFLSYNQQGDGLTWAKGKETVTFTLKKFKDVWRIVHFSAVNFQTEQNKGTCFYEIFFASTGNAIAKTTIPKGDTFSKNLDAFDIRAGKELTLIQLSDKNKNYSFYKNGNIDLDGNSIAVAADNREAILMILENDLYKDSCIEWERRR